MRLLVIAPAFEENFILPVVRYWPGSVLETIATPSPAYFRRLVRKAAEFDAVLFEWAGSITRHGVNDYDWPVPVFVRVHDYEVWQRDRATIPAQAIHWERVQGIWFVNRHIQARFAEIMQQPPLSFVFPNLLDPSDYRFTPCAEKRVGVVTIFTRPRKRLDRVLELAALLPDYTFTIRCDPFGGSPAMQAHYLELRDREKELGLRNVEWDIRPFQTISCGYLKDDLNAFFADKSFVLSTSEHEAFHYTIAEGILCGCWPVVFDWEFGGAKDFWGEFVTGSIPFMAHLIRNADLSLLPEIRYWALARYGADVWAGEVIRKINSLCK